MRSNLLPTVLLGPTFLAATLAAQGPSLLTDGPVGVFTRLGREVQHETLAPNTEITAPTTLAARNDHAAAGLAVAPGRGPGRFELRETGAATADRDGAGVAGTTATPRGGVVGQSAHAFLLRSGGPARLAVRLGGDAQGTARAVLAIDVDADGTIDWRQAVDGQPHAQVFSFGSARGGRVRILVDAVAEASPQSLRSGYALDASFELSDQPGGEPPCRFEPYGDGCRVTLEGNDRVLGGVHNIELAVRGGFPNQPVVLSFGVRRVDLPIPNTPCRLYLVPVVSVAIQADAQGNLDNTFFTGPLGGVVLIQAFPLNTRPLELRSSNGLRMICGL